MEGLGRERDADLSLHLWNAFQLGRGKDRRTVEIDGRQVSLFPLLPFIFPRGEVPDNRGARALLLASETKRAETQRYYYKPLLTKRPC